MIETKWGTFRKGEEVAIVMYSSCGQEYVYKGTVEGKRECMGKEYIVIMGEDGYSYDVGANEGARILSGQAAADAIAKSYTKRHRKIKESLAHEKDSDMDNRDDYDRAMHQESQYQESVYNAPTKYNRI